METAMIITPGDILSRRKGIFTHKGVFLGKGRIFHTMPGKSAHVCSWDEFADGRKVHVRRLSDSDRVRVLNAVTDELSASRRYHPLNNNCQHLVNRLRRGISFSEELLASVFVATGVVALVLARVRR